MRDWGRVAAVSLLLLAAWPASAGLEAGAGDGAFLDAVSQPSDINFAAFKHADATAAAGPDRQVAVGSQGAPLYSVPLASQLDNLWHTSTVFRAGGAAVHIFGDKSDNKKSWFLGLAMENGTAQFAKGWKILHWMVKSGTWHATINGKRFDVFVQGQVVNRLQSRIIVQPRDPGETGASFTAAELADASFQAGLPLRIGGTEYRLIYTRDFNEDDDGNFSGFNGQRSIVLMYRKASGSYGAYHWYEREIPSSAILISTPRAVSDETYSDGDLTVGLRNNGGTLEVYYPVQPPAIVSR